jgi:hypothetical protein
MKRRSWSARSRPRCGCRAQTNPLHASAAEPIHADSQAGTTGDLAVDDVREVVEVRRLAPE